jgi:S-adenosylmethionine decarboxylase
MNFNQIITDFYYKDIDFDIKKEMDKSVAEIGDLTVIYSHQHDFEPQGISILYILAESHISIHVWEELNFMTVDIFTCGDYDPKKTLNNFLDKFNIIKHETKEFKRGKV